MRCLGCDRLRTRQERWVGTRSGGGRATAPRGRCTGSRSAPTAAGGSSRRW
jgi:hypothetical protein